MQNTQVVAHESADGGKAIIARSFVDFVCRLETKYIIILEAEPAKYGRVFLTSAFRHADYSLVVARLGGGPGAGKGVSPCGYIIGS